MQVLIPKLTQSLFAKPPFDNKKAEDNTRLVLLPTCDLRCLDNFTCDDWTMGSCDQFFSQLTGNYSLYLALYTETNYGDFFCWER